MCQVREKCIASSPPNRFLGFIIKDAFLRSSPHPKRPPSPASAYDALLLERMRAPRQPIFWQPFFSFCAPAGVYVCIAICVCRSVCMYVCVYRSCRFLCMCSCVCVCIYISLCPYLCKNASVCMRVSVCIHMYFCAWLNVFYCGKKATWSFFQAQIW